MRYWLGLVISLGLLAVAYFYFQLHMGLAPCPLCMAQRAALVGVATICLLGVLFKPADLAINKLFAFVIALFSLLGLASAGRQAWLQHLPAELVPECGPDINYMLQNFPLAEVLQTVIYGSGSCAEVQWRFLFLSMAEWMVVIFTVMVFVAIKLFLKRSQRYFS